MAEFVPHLVIVTPNIVDDNPADPDPDPEPIPVTGDIWRTLVLELGRTIVRVMEGR